MSPRSRNKKQRKSGAEPQVLTLVLRSSRCFSLPAAPALAMSTRCLSAQTQACSSRPSHATHPQNPHLPCPLLDRTTPMTLLSSPAPSAHGPPHPASSLRSCTPSCHRQLESCARPPTDPRRPAYPLRHPIPLLLSARGPSGQGYLLQRCRSLHGQGAGQ